MVAVFAVNSRPATNPALSSSTALWSANFEVKHQLDEIFAKDPLFARSNLNARVDSRRIVLNGTVETEEQHQSAIRAAETYAGGRKIVDNIVVRSRT